MIRRIASIPISLFPRLSSQFAFVEMQICSNCSFIQTKRPFRDDDIMRLYADYRSSSYNLERIRFEPDYASIAARVGYDEVEVRNRTGALATFLRRNLGSGQTRTILDYGGADGRFIPEIPGRRFVFEVSDVDPIPGVTRIDSEADLGRYAIVLLAHVIEHVPHPLDLVQKVASYVEPEGFLYIETPQEIADGERDGLRRGSLCLDVGIHEHINSYCVPAVERLLDTAGFEVIAVESSPVDVGWAKAIHIRALGRKRS
jgi:Methyltransferase domain